MNRSCFRLHLIALTVIVAFSFFASPHSIAQEAITTLSGRVVDVHGKPIAGLPIAIQPVEATDGGEQRGHLSFLESQTDDAGHFSITNIVPVSVQLVVLPYDAPDHEILSIKIGAVTLYEHKPVPFMPGMTFAIKPGTHIKDVEVKAKPRMRMRGRIVFADGRPLVNATVGLKMRHRHLDGMGSGSSSSSTTTDDAGYFVKYLNKPRLYTVTVNYQGLSATVEPFSLREGERKDDLLFTFDREPISADSPSGRVEASAAASTSPSAGAGVWVVNPTNGHAYKSISCKSWDDANSQAVAENAHLVAINDAAEQKWLSEVFGHGPYWIGLTDFEKEGEWEWTNSEPVTYTNWSLHEPMDADSGEEDYVIMFGEWLDIGPESLNWKFTRMAIIERENPPGKMPVEEK